MLVALVVLTVFTLTTALAYMLTSRITQRAAGLQSRRDRLVSKAPSPSVDALLNLPTSAMLEKVREQEASAPKDERPDFLPLFTRMLNGRAMEVKLRLEMVRAGWRLRPGEFIGLCLGSGIALMVAGLTFTRQPICLLAIGLGGLGVPRLLLRQQQGARRSKFDAQLPDAMTLIASSMRSGYSFSRAMQLVVDEMANPIAEEFAWALGESSLGVSADIALNHMVEHVNSRDLELVVVAVTIHMQVGGNLAEILDTISETIRERMRIQGEIKSLTAEGKLSGFVLFVLPVFLALALKMKDPDYFKPLLDSTYGAVIIGGGVLAQALGGVVINKMVTLDI